MKSAIEVDAPESRWPAIVAMVAVGGVYLALPDSLTVGPRWLHPAILVFLLAATIVTHRRGNHAANQLLGKILAGAITFFLIWSLVLLVVAVPAHKESPGTMLRSAASLWITNVLVFAYWYWRLDGGGPHRRDLRVWHPSRGFLFPQMTLPNAGDAGRADAPTWAPGFMDYLFLAFNTSMAFSPTDAPVLSRWAKALTMMQAAISLTVVVVLAARAINIF